MKKFTFLTTRQRTCGGSPLTSSEHSERCICSARGRSGSPISPAVNFPPIFKQRTSEFSSPHVCLSAWLAFCNFSHLHLWRGALVCSQHPSASALRDVQVQNSGPSLLFSHHSIQALNTCQPKAPPDLSQMALRSYECLKTSPELFSSFVNFSQPLVNASARLLPKPKAGQGFSVRFLCILLKTFHFI